MKLDDLDHPPPTMAEVAATRVGKPIAKGPTRREVNDGNRLDRAALEKVFKLTVYARDGRTCRKCGRQVRAHFGRLGARREIHHIHGRIGALEFEPRSALQLCLECHEEATGTVGGVKLLIKAIAFFELPMKGGLMRHCVDATGQVIFERHADNLVVVSLG